MQEKFNCTWPRVIGSSRPVGGPGRLPPRVRDENALLYISFHLPCSLSTSVERSTGPPTASSSLAAASAIFTSSSLAARPLFNPETALCQIPTQMYSEKSLKCVNRQIYYIALQLLQNSGNFTYLHVCWELSHGWQINPCKTVRGIIVETITGHLRSTSNE